VSRLLVFVMILLLSIYLLALGWTGQEFLPYANADHALDLDAVEPINVPLNESLEIELTGSGFTDETRAFMHLDVNNQDAVVGSFPLLSIPHDLELYDDTLVVASNGNGLHRIDVSRPLAPKVMMHPWVSMSSVLDIKRHGDFFYLSCAKKGVEIARTSSSGRLSRVRRLNSWSIALASEVVGNYLFVAANIDGVLVYDLDDPKNDRPIETHDFGVRVRGLAVYEDYLYLVAGREGVIICRVAKDGGLQQVGRMATQRIAKSVEIFGDTLFLLEQGRVSQFSLVRPEKPELIVGRSYVDSPAKILPVGDQLYVIDVLNGLGVIDMRSGQLAPSIEFMGVGGKPRSIIQVGDYLYVATAGNELKIIDPQKILPRQTVCSITASGLQDGLPPAAVSDLLLVGHYLYFTDRQAAYQRDLSIQDCQPQLLAKGAFVSFAYADGYLFAAKHQGGIEVFDVSQPGQVARVAEWPDIRAQHLKVKENYLLVAHPTNGVALFDISNFSKPIALDHVDDAAAQRIDVEEGLVAIAVEEQGVKFYRLENERLSYVSRLDLPFPLSGFSMTTNLQIVDKKIFVANGDAGLMIADISNPEGPKLISALKLPGFVNGVLVDGDLALVASRYSGMHTVDISDISAPRLVNSMNIPEISKSLQIRNGMIFVNNGVRGITVIPEPVELHTKRLSAEKLGIKIPSSQLPGRYNLQVTRKGTSATLSSVLVVE